jgi:hypothetical protein
MQARANAFGVVTGACRFWERKSLRLRRGQFSGFRSFVIAGSFAALSLKGAGDDELWKSSL